MPHDSGFERVDRKLDRAATPFVKEAFQRAEYWLKNKAIDPLKLGEPFDQEAAKRDAAYVKKMEAQWGSSETPEQKEERMVSTIFEVSLWWLTQQRKFFGERAKAILPSRIDDLNGTDLILGIEGGDSQMSYLGLGIDATFGAAAVEGKLSELGGMIKDGKTNRIKYFVSPDGKLKGSFDGVPHAVVGLSVEHAKELGALWRNSETNSKVTTPIEMHPLRALVLKQLVNQAGAAATLARAHGNTELAASYSAVYNRLSAIAIKAEQSVKDWRSPAGTDYRIDPVHSKIMASAEYWRQQAKSKAEKGGS